jgi:putative ABC transport system permease protein
LSVFDRTFAITRALELVSSLVAVIAVLTVLYALLAERAGDLALLWSLGATRAGLFAQILLQAAWIGLIGALLGILTGLAIGVVLVDVVNLQSFGWTIRYLQPYESCVRMLVLVVVFAGIAGTLPALRVLSSPAARILREEGT